MIQIIKKNEYDFNLDEIASISNSKQKLKTIWESTKDLVNNLKREMDPEQRKFKSNNNKN